MFKLSFTRRADWFSKSRYVELRLALCVFTIDQTCTVTDLHLVAIAGSSIRRPADVILYCKPRSEHGHVQIAKLTGAHRDPGTQESGTSAFERMCWGIMIALLIVYGAIVVVSV